MQRTLYLNNHVFVLANEMRQVQKKRIKIWPHFAN